MRAGYEEAVVVEHIKGLPHVGQKKKGKGGESFQNNLDLQLCISSKEP